MWCKLSRSSCLFLGSCGSCTSKSTDTRDLPDTCLVALYQSLVGIMLDLDNLECPFVLLQCSRVHQAGVLSARRWGQCAAPCHELGSSDRTCSAQVINGATSLQGPHQGAQKSTSTGTSLCAADRVAGHSTVATNSATCSARWHHQGVQLFQETH